jgi:exportin-T
VKVISYLEMNRLILVNRSKFEAVLESIVRYATDTSDATVEKIAFSILNKMVRVWSGPIAAEANGGGNTLANSFHNAFAQFVVEHLSRVCFEVPSKSTFNSNDAQSRLVGLSSIIP